MTTESTGHDSRKRATIGVAMIAKNEMEFIARALDSVKDADQRVVCDTGSTDNGETMRIAREHGAEVYDDYKWEDSFCKARNHVKSKMTTDWILSLDCDEYIGRNGVIGDFEQVRRAVEFADANGIKAIDILQHAEDNTAQTNIFPRLFKNDPEIVWYGNAHNYISVLGTLLVEENGVIRTARDHSPEEKEKALVHLTFGYSLAHLQDPDRTLRILEKTVQSGEGGAREMFYLGREYFYKRRFQDASRMLGRYVQTSSFLSEKAEAFLIMANCYWLQGLGEDARDACLQAIKINPNFKEAIHFMAQLVWPHHRPQWERMMETADNSEVLFVRKLPPLPPIPKQPVEQHA